MEINKVTYLVLLAILGGCATAPPPAPCVCACIAPPPKPAPAFLAPATTFMAWDLLDAQKAAEEAARGVDETEVVREAQATFQINELQAELDGLVRP